MKPWLNVSEAAEYAGVSRDTIYTACELPRASKCARKRRAIRIRRQWIDAWHLSRRMLEHYSHIRIDAKRQALDALDAARRAAGNGNGDGANETGMETYVEVSDDLTSQSRHSLRLSGSPPHGKLLIPLERRDVRVVEGSTLGKRSGRATLSHSETR